MKQQNVTVYSVIDFLFDYPDRKTYYNVTKNVKCGLKERDKAM